MLISFKTIVTIDTTTHTHIYIVAIRYSSTLGGDECANSPLHGRWVKRPQVPLVYPGLPWLALGSRLAA